MIAKLIEGSGFRAALAYDLGKVDGYLLDTNMAGEGIRQLTAEFAAISRMRPNLMRKALHVSLSATPGEKLTDDQWAAIGRQYLEGMGLVDNQYLTTRHCDTEHEHVHILANRISTCTGKTVSDSRDYARQEALMRVIERDFGLASVTPSREAKRRSQTRGELFKEARTGEVSTKKQLQRLADSAIEGCTSYACYQERLAAAGVQLHPVLQQGELLGLLYQLDGVVMKGSDLGKGYSPAGLVLRGVRYEPDPIAATNGLSDDGGRSELVACRLSLP